jgi:hypothetical protein
MRKYACFALFVLAAVAYPAAAEEILYLTNGSQMPVVSHWVEGDMIHVDLGGNGFMAFPKSLVERIDSDTKLQLKPSTVSSAPRGRMATSRGGGRPGRSSRPAPLPLQVDDSVETDKYGMAIVTPLKGKGRAAEKLKRYASPGRRPVAGQRQNGGYQGTTREGSHHVIDSGQRTPKRRVGVQRR